MFRPVTRPAIQIARLTTNGLEASAGAVAQHAPGPSQLARQTGPLQKRVAATLAGPSAAPPRVPLTQLQKIGMAGLKGTAKTAYEDTTGHKLPQGSVSREGVAVGTLIKATRYALKDSSDFEAKPRLPGFAARLDDKT